jgi:hypothetical protein
MSQLLEHFEALGRLAQGTSAPARTRLETELGAELAARLVGGLTRRGRAVIR